MAPHIFSHRLIHKFSSNNLSSSSIKPTTRHIGWAAKLPQPQATSEDFMKQDRVGDAQAHEFNLLKREGFDFRPSDTLPWSQNVSEPTLSAWDERPLAKYPVRPARPSEGHEPRVSQASMSKAAVLVPTRKASLPSPGLDLGEYAKVAGPRTSFARPPVTKRTALHSNPNPYYRGRLSMSHMELAAKPRRRGGAVKASHTPQPMLAHPYKISTTHHIPGASSSTPSFATLPVPKAPASQSRRQASAHLRGRHVRPTIRSLPPPVAATIGAALPQRHVKWCASPTLQPPATLSSSTSTLPISHIPASTSPASPKSDDAIANTLNMSNADSMAMRSLGTRVQRHRNSTFKPYRQDAEPTDDLLEPEVAGFDYVPQNMTSRTNLAVERSERNERITKHIAESNQHSRPRSLTDPRQQTPALAPALGKVVDKPIPSKSPVHADSSAGIDSDSTCSETTSTRAVVGLTNDRSAMQAEFEGIYDAIAMSVSRHYWSEVRVVDVAGGLRRSSSY